MSNPLFTYFDTHRDSSERNLFDPHIGTIKCYDNVPVTSLPVPDEITASYSQLIRQRGSHRAFEGMKLSVPDLASILYWSMSPLATGAQVNVGGNTHDESERRPHPSGGAKYPLEAYVVTDKHTELGTAAYHYRPDIHVLEQVSVLSEQEMSVVKKSYIYKTVPPIPVFIMLTYIMERNVPKYGALGGKLALIESGHIGQNIALTADGCGVSSLMLSGGDHPYIDSLLGLDSYNESMFYTIGLGKHYT